MIRREDGFTVVEMLVAALLLVVGVLAVFSTLDASRSLSNVAERQTSMVHRAQREVERVQSLAFDTVAMTSAPSHSATTSNPDYYVANGPPATYQWDRNNAGTAEQFATDSAGVFTTTAIGSAQPCSAAATNPCSWTDGRQSGYVYDYVTWHTDASCGTACPASNNYKRLTVAVTRTGAGAPSKPLVVSTLLANPNSQPAGYVTNGVENPLQSPSTTCGTPPVPCTNGLGSGTPLTWFLYDTDATSSSTRQTIAGNHTTHPTLAITNILCATLGIGCPKPDLMGTAPPVADAACTTICKYSTDISTAVGKLLHRDTACGSAPSTTDNTKGEVWVTPQLGANTTLTGDGGMTVWVQTANGAAVSVKLCVAIYDYPPSILNLISLPPIQLGVVSYTSVETPTVPTPISFNFGFLAANTTKLVVAGHRIGVRVWLAASAASDATLIYDHPSASSQLQLNAQ